MTGPAYRHNGKAGTEGTIEQIILCFVVQMDSTWTDAFIFSSYPFFVMWKLSLISSTKVLVSQDVTRRLSVVHY